MKKKWVWTPERKEFCRLYVQTHNSIQSYARSHNVPLTGPDATPYRVVNNRASRLLNNRHIKDEIFAREIPFWQMFPLSADALLAQAAVIAFANMGDYFDFTGDQLTQKPANRITRHQQSAIERVKIKTETRQVKVGEDDQGKPVYEKRRTQTVDLKLYAKTKSLEMLIRTFGIGTQEDVVQELLKMLPLELRGQVAAILLQKMEAEEKRRVRG